MGIFLLSLISMNVQGHFSHTLLYIDPGTGSIILQALAAAVAGAAITARLYWHRILKFFGSGKNTGDETSPGTDDV